MAELSKRVLIARHVIETLPDHVSARRQLLEAVTELLPPGHDLRTRAAILLLQLLDHEKTLHELQKELPLFEPPAAAPKTGPVTPGKPDRK